MNLDISEKVFLQIRAVLLAAAQEDHCPHVWLTEWWPTPSDCDRIVDMIDASWEKQEAAKEAYFASLFGETE